MTRKPATRHHALAAAVLALASSGAGAVGYSWTSGNFAPGVTAPSPLGAGDVLDIGAGGNKFFNGPASNFSNAGGTVNWNADPLYLQSGAAVVNSALWNASGDNALIYNGGAGPSFTNNGTFRKTGGAGNTTINSGVGFVNNGTLDAQTGAINFVGGSVFNSGTVFTGAGVVNVSAGTNTFNGNFSSSNLLLSGGSQAGAGAVLAGSAAWSGGDLTGSWSIGAGQTLLGTTGGTKILNGAGTLLVNQGTLTWNTANPLYLQSGAVLRNEGLFVAAQNTSLLYNGGSSTTFENKVGGTVRAAAGSTLTVNTNVGFVNNGGTLEAQAATSSIRYAGSAFNAGTLFSGAGSNVAAGINSFGGSINSNNLVLESGVHIGNAALLSGSVSWTGGALTGTWTVAAGQTLKGQSGGVKNMDGAVLTNLGTIDWGSGNSLYLQSSAALSNQGLFLASENTALTYNGGSGPSFDNTSSGTVRAAAGKTLTIGNIVGFVNNGGVLDAQAGASIVYGGGSVFNAGTQFTGAGSNVAVASNTFNGAFNSANLELQGGTHIGGGAVMNGTPALTGGSLVGTWTVAAGATLRGLEGDVKMVVGAGTVLTNLGTIAWATANPLYLQSGASVSNQGLFLASETTSWTYNGGAGPVFDNTGTVRAAAGKTLTIGNLFGFVNNGGVLEAAAGAAIIYGGGSTLNAGTQFIGAGSSIAAGNNAFNGALSSSNLVLQSGTHSGGNAVLSGSTRYTGGSLAGTWKVGAGQTLQGASGDVKIILGALTNQGRIAWGSADALYLQSGGSLDNQGTIDFGTDSAVIYNGGAQPSFVNTGLIVKSGGIGTTSIGNSLGFDNQGLVDVQTGTLALPANFTNNGTLKGVGTYALAGTLSNAGTVAPGASPGTLGLAGNYAQTAAGTFAVELQSLASHDLFNISGTAALNGRLALFCFAACSFAVGDLITILDAAGDLSGTFSAGITLSGFATGAFQPIYDSAADRVQLLVTQAVTAAVPEPEVYALMLAGLSAIAWLARRRRAGGVY